MALPNIWIPRRDARGLFVPTGLGFRQPSSGVVGSPLRHYNYPVLGSDGIYTSVLDRVIRKSQASYGGNLRSVLTPFGPGIDAQTGWTFTGYPTQGGGWNVARQTWVSLFYIYDNAKVITNYPRFFGQVSNNPSNRLQTISWINTAGEKALVVSSQKDYSGGEVSITGVDNGLHCVVVTSITGSVADGVRVFLDGRLAATTNGPTVWNGGTFPTTDFYGASVSQSGSNIGNILFNALIYNYIASDTEAAALSTNPYRYFFRDAPSSLSTMTRNLSFDPTNYQYYRPSADLNNSGWTRIPV